MDQPAESLHPLYHPLDVAALATEFRRGQPFPHVAIPGFLDDAFAREVATSYSSFDEARHLGREFRAVNERGKVQITSPEAFPPAVLQLSELLASPELLATFSQITGISSLLADEELVGGGMHLMSPSAHLDVHVDFNLIEARGIYRRLNLLLFLNQEWQESWGGELELWDESVSRCERSFRPEFNLLVLFATSERSFHGVRQVLSPAGRARLSYASYYYTREAPSEDASKAHDTIFRSRPDERWKGHVLMPAERALYRARSLLRRAARLARRD